MQHENKCGDLESFNCLMVLHAYIKLENSWHKIQAFTKEEMISIGLHNSVNNNLK